jgi:threonine synthase
MSNNWLECDWCRSRFDVGPMFYGCPNCAQKGKKRPVEMKYAIDGFQPEMSPGVWRWASLLPPADPDRRVTLYEGSTPLIPIDLPDSNATTFLKNETINPTWSWKDRPNAVSISMARQFGFRRVTARSTGNHGNSIAAYAAAAGLDATILCHENTAQLQLALMESFGARVIRGGCQDKIITWMLAAQAYFPCTILCPRAGYSNPFGIEGFKTIAFEIVDALGGSAPDRVFIPVGSGDGAYGIWKGFREMAERKQITAAPRIVACQPQGANSASRAWKLRRNHVAPLMQVKTDALSVAELVTGDHALRTVYESQGEFCEASEPEILQAAQALRRAGLALELASALPYACALRTRAAQRSPEREVWVLIGSGAAVKWPEMFLKDYSKPVMLGGEVEELSGLVDSLQEPEI